MQVTIVLGSYNRRWFLEKAILSVRKSRTSIPMEIIVVDGGSTDGSLEWLCAQKDIITLVQHNRGTWQGKEIERQSWGFFMNMAFKIAHGKFVLMISDDCLLHPDAIENGVRHFESLLGEGRRVGAVPFFWRDWPTMKEFQVGKTFGEKPFVNHGLYSAEALREVGYVDEKRYFFYHADGDLCLRMIQAGFEIVPCSRSFVVHYSEANLAVRATNMAKQQKDWAAYQDRWRNIYYFEGREESNREVLSPDLAPTDWGAEDYWSDYSPEGLIIAYRKLKLDLKRRIRARLTNGGSQGRET